MVKSKDWTIEEIMSYTEILDHAQNQDDQDQIEWHFKYIALPESHLPRNIHDYNRSLLNTMI